MAGMTWNQLKKHVDDELNNINSNGDVKVGCIDISSGGLESATPMPGVCITNRFGENVLVIDQSYY